MSIVLRARRGLQRLDAAIVEELVRFRGAAVIPGLLCAFVLVGMLVHALIAGVDADMFVNADTLYPVQILHFDWLAYRPPPSNNLFPDVFAHALIGAWVTDPFTQKIAVGASIFFLTCVLLSAAFGATGVLALLFAYAFSGFYFLDSTAHFSLPLCLLLWLLIPARTVRNVILFLSVFSDLLFLVPYLICRVTGVGRRQSENLSRKQIRLEWVIIAVAVVLNVVYAEYSTGAFKLIPLIGLFAAGLTVIRQLDASHLVCLAMAAFLLLAILFGVPARYSSPVAACLLLLLVAAFGDRALSYPGLVGYLAPTLALAVFASTVNTGEMRQMQQRFECLARAISDREISNVAVDHWTAKPLYFSWINQYDGPLTISQMDFEWVVPHIWMGPHEMFGAPTRWSVHNRNACSRFTSEPKFCGQLELPGIVEQTPVCEIFDLVEYSEPVPRSAIVKPEGKLGFGWFNIKRYARKLSELIGS